MLALIFEPTNKFDPLYANTAKFIYDRLEAEHWGADETSIDADNESAAVATSSSAPASSGGSATRTPPADEPKLPRQLPLSQLPADSDPVYGLEGPMHHILRIKTAKTTKYMIDPTWIRPQTAKFFGQHASLAVGQCWATQMALVRDGVHGT